jgi:hypothetical protein
MHIEYTTLYFCFLYFPLLQICDMSKKSALLIGINYTSTPSARLSGCINDIVNVRAMLIDAYEFPVDSITMLRDDVASSMPTLANIMAALATILGKSGANDEIWIHYSGHGSQVRDVMGGDENDGMDETIVPCDFVKNGMIVDDAIFGLLQTAHPQATIFVCFDSCHSGSALDLQYSCNYNTATSSSSITTVKGGKILSSIPNVYFFSGCLDAQTSADAYSNLEKLSVGAFTDAFIESLRKHNHSIGIVALHTAICKRLIASGYRQIPALSSSSQDFNYTFRRKNDSSTVASSTVVAPNVVPLASKPPVVPLSKPPTKPPTKPVKTIFSYMIDPYTGQSIPIATSPAHLRMANKN